METQTAETSAVNPHIPLLILEGKRRAEQIMRQNEAAAEARVLQERARIAELWQPIRELLNAVLPEYVRPYLKESDQEPATYRHGYAEYNPLTLALPGLAPIRVYVDGNSIGYSVPRTTLALDEYGDDGWQARYSWPDYSVTHQQIRGMTDDLAVAAYQAEKLGQEYAKLAAEAEQRNREDAVRPAPPEPDPDPDPDPEPTALSLARKMVRVLMEAGVACVEPAAREAMVYAAIAQAEALTRLAEVAETMLKAGILGTADHA